MDSSKKKKKRMCGFWFSSKYFWIVWILKICFSLQGELELTHMFVASWAIASDECWKFYLPHFSIEFVKLHLQLMGTCNKDAVLFEIIRVFFWLIQKFHMHSSITTLLLQSVTSFAKILSNCACSKLVLVILLWLLECIFRGL